MIRLLVLLALLPGIAGAIDEPMPEPEEPVTSPAEDHPVLLREKIDSLNHANLQEAFRILTRDSIQRDSLDSLEINRSALQGMLDRLDFGAMLLTEKDRDERNSPFLFHSTRIEPDPVYLQFGGDTRSGREELEDTLEEFPKLGYIRFGRYTRNGLEDLDAALEIFREDDEVEALIIDLRSPQAQAAFSIAAKILSRFRPPNELLFKIRRPGNDRPTLFVSEPIETNWSGEIVLLVDQETGNVGEIIAAVLKRETGCLVIGEKTPGLSVEYRDVPIGENRILRYAVAEVVLEDNSSLFQKGIEPDIVTPTPLKTKHRIYRQTQTGTDLSEFLFQKQRPRMNEAALVAGTDPEIDYYLLRSNRKPTPWDEAPLQDRALQQAVDLLATHAFLNSEERSGR